MHRDSYVMLRFRQSNANDMKENARDNIRVEVSEVEKILR